MTDRDLTTRSAYAFDLPSELIAASPPAERSGSRLLVLDRDAGKLRDDAFTSLPQLLAPGDLLVFNNTRVIKARLYGTKQTGGRIEILLERIEGDQARAQIRASKSPQPGSRLLVADVEIEVTGREGSFFLLRTDADWYALTDAHGHVPLPPYIQRPDTELDAERYQTVYASQPGAVAAPTAGLHFDKALLDRLHARGIKTTEITLHVGAGTFQPMRADRLADHVMHEERYQVSAEAADAIAATKAGGGRVVAVGTTSCRTLEAVARNHGKVVADSGSTDLFLHPGNNRFHAIDALITNFHLSESTLIMLVSAFAGYDTIMQAYQHAIDERYRFFSYGDAMLIL